MLRRARRRILHDEETVALNGGVQSAIGGLNRPLREILNHGRLARPETHRRLPVAEAQRRRPLRGLRAQGVALELNLAGAERKHPGDQIERGALAGAIGPDQSDDAAALNLEADVIHGD